MRGRITAFGLILGLIASGQMAAHSVRAAGTHADRLLFQWKLPKKAQGGAWLNSEGSWF